MANKIVLFKGSGKDFEKLLSKSIGENETSVEFLEAIRTYNKRVRASDYAVPDLDLDEAQHVDNCIVRADDFGSVVGHVISNFANIVTQSYDFDTLYVQNPPRQAEASLRTAFPDSIEVRTSNYKRIRKSSLKTVYEKLKWGILGQEACKMNLVSSLYQLSVMNSKKPAVLMFYGPSGVGKTETAKCMSTILGGKLTRIQFSMMQTAEAYNYVFGAEHSHVSFARDLLARESNIILIDEFDKVDPRFYNAFYQMFDEGVFLDTYYDVSLPSALFICTSNFSSENEIRRVLGPAMFSRIGACVKFEELGIDEKRQIASRHFDEIVKHLDKDDKAYIDERGVRQWFLQNAGRYNNIRLMKTKIERAVFDTLTNRIIN